MTREIRITPSILNADFSRLDEEIKRIADVSDLLHLDVMDDVFVPNFTFDFEAASALGHRHLCVVRRRAAQHAEWLHQCARQNQNDLAPPAI